MGCGCNKSGVKYEIRLPGQAPIYRDTASEAKGVLQQAGNPPGATWKAVPA